MFYSFASRFRRVQQKMLYVAAVGVTSSKIYLQAGTGERGYSPHGQVLPVCLHCCCPLHILAISNTVLIGRGGRKIFGTVR